MKRENERGRRERSQILKFILGKAFVFQFSGKPLNMT
jgi:hypothetical protein